jgi:hypothetical protein
MADKRISQLVDRGTVVNNDVIPIVVSGATTTNKATISSIQTFMQGNLDLGVTSVGISIGTSGTNVSVSGSPVTSSGNITINIPTASATNRGALSSADWSTFNSKVSSVGLSMPSAFTVANSPITGSGTIAVTGAGTVSQYVRGDGSLADFPQGGGGGGASVSYYLNGSVSQGTIGGVAYLEMNKTPILGAGTDFTIAADGYIASFITDAGDPGLLEIPAGNWNFETYFQASSSGGSPTFYVELYKVNSGGTATLIASSSANPELIAFGTSTTPYFSALAVPTTVLTITDRLAIRYYVVHSGRTITLHTENGNLCQIITTFTTGLTALNGLTAQVQNFATGTSGTDFNISSASTTHTFNIPSASATNRGLVTTGSQTIAGIKSFDSTVVINQDIQLITQGTALNTFIKNINAAGLTSIGSNGFGFNNSNNIYFSGSSKGGGIFAFSNTGNQTYTLQDASGTVAFTSDISTALAAYVTLATAQTITAQKTFTTSGGTDSVIISTTGAGFALDAIKAGNGEVIRVNKTSGTGNAMTVIGGNFEAPTIVKTGGTSSQFLMADGSVNTSVLASGAYLPLAGGTMTGAIVGTTSTFTNAGSGIGVGVTNSGSGDGIKITHSAGRAFQILSSGAGYGVIINNETASTSAPFTIQKQGLNKVAFTDAGAADFSSSVTASSFVKTSGTSAQFLKADGSVDSSTYLTTGSAASTYLPLAGGTLTGALNGTSASFSSSVTPTGITNNGIYYGKANASFPATSLGYFALKTNNLDGERGGLTVQVSNATSTFIDALTINYTGAATFSGSVTALNATFKNQGSAPNNTLFVQTSDYASGSVGSVLRLGHVATTGSTTAIIQNLTAGGTAAGNISFPEGNVGIGTASPLSKLTVWTPTTQSNAGVWSNCGIAMHNSTSVGDYSQIGLGYATVGTNAAAYIGLISTSAASYGKGDIVFGTRDVTTDTQPTERMRITSGGFLKASNNGTYLSSAGNFHEIRSNSSNSYSLVVQHSASSNPYGLGIFFTASSPNSTSNEFIYCEDTTQSKFIVWSNGSAINRTGSYGTISDIKFKENIVDASPKLDDILKLKVRNFNLIGDEQKQIGFIAQEFEEVFPSMVDVSIDKESEEEYKSIKTSVLIPMLVKAIQEQQEQIDSLKKQIK